MTIISLRISKEDKNKLMEYAKQNDLTISQVIRRAIRLFFKQNAE